MEYTTDAIHMQQRYDFCIAVKPSLISASISELASSKLFESFEGSFESWDPISIIPSSSIGATFLATSILEARLTTPRQQTATMV